jgi:uncharacterized phage infection (PIP) family protein YhgE
MYGCYEHKHEGRIVKMNNFKKVFVLLLITTIVSLTLTGCKDAEKEAAIAEAQATKTELAKVKESLASIISERDAAIAKATSSETMVDKIKNQLALQTQKFTDLESQSKKLQEMLDQANTIKDRGVDG